MLITGGKAFQEQGIISAKAQKHKHGWYPGPKPTYQNSNPSMRLYMVTGIN